MKRHRLLIVLIGALFIGVTAALVSGDQGLMTFYRTWKRIARLDRKLADSHRIADSLAIEVNRLKNDTTYMERIAREKYGMARENEQMYKFIEEK